MIMTGRDWVLLITLSILWGGSFFFIGVAVTGLPVLTIVALRVGIAALTLWGVLAVIRAAIPRNRTVWAALLVMGILNNVIPFSLIVWAQTQIPSGVASILNATTPLFTVLVAGVVLSDERMTPARIAGVLLGLLGVAVMQWSDAGETPVLAVLAMLGAAVSYGCAATWGRRFRALGVTPIMTATGQVTMSALFLGGLALVVDQPWSLPPAPANVWAAVIALATLSTAFAYILYFRVLQSAGATNIALVTLLVPVSAVVLGVVFLNETLAMRHVAGMGLITLGLAVIDGRPLRAVRRLTS